jgi:hypothetical protein
MNDPIQTIVDNREWIFSGIGVAVLSGIIALIRSAGRLSRAEIASPRGPPSYTALTETSELLIHPRDQEPNAPPFMFMLPNGETVDPFKVDRITVSNDSYANVCYWIGNRRSSFFASSSRAEALRVANEVTMAINRVRGYRAV